MSTSLYLIRTDAVLIHPSLPGFPITNPPRMAAKPTSPHAQFTVASALPPISWPGTLAWYGVKQLQRKHTWPLRALLHLYLMVSLRHIVGEQPGASLNFIHDNPTTGYQALLDSGTHYVGNFWVRFPEMLVLALSTSKEPAVAQIIAALVETARANDQQHKRGGESIEAMLDQFTLLAQRIQSTIDSSPHRGTNTALQALGLTRRRAGVIERALIGTLRALSPASATVTRLVPSLPKTNANKMLISHRATTQHTLGDAYDRLTEAPSHTISL